MIQTRYRDSYDGEFVVVNTNVRFGIKEQRREWMPNPITNQHISGRAAVISGSLDRKKINPLLLQRHRGGLLGKHKLQTYGSGRAYEDLRLDFYCGTNRPDLVKIVSSKYHSSSIVYTTMRFCQTWPESFFLIPYQPQLDDLAAAAYLAAFDGHQEIFLLGYDKDTEAATRDWQQDVAEVIRAYGTHQFVFVGVEANMPDVWRDLANTDYWNYRRFVTYCDI